MSVTMESLLRCADRAVPGTWTWRKASGPSVRLTPPGYCPTPSEWHVVAGYLNEPAATIDYTAP